MRSGKLLYCGLFFGLMLSLVNCAKRGTPSGGPQDETPPEIISSKPGNYSIDFDAKEITITFDEYVTLKELQKQLVVSPPLKNPPVISPQSGAAKRIKIEISDTLKENTTYLLNFGQSIVDHNEANPYPFYKYVFSTGDYIDSLELGGLIKDASQKEPDNFISVMLYEMDTAYTDSAVYRKQPTYITSTLDSAVNFNLTNLKEGTYRLIAMKDEASDNLFSPKTDKIGFISDPVELPTDSVYQLTLFREVPEFRLRRPVMVNKDKIAFGFEGDPEGMEIEILSQVPEDFQYTTIRDQEADSLNYYFNPIEADSLIFRVKKNEVIDTFTVRVRNLYRDSLQIEALTQGNLQLKDTFSLTSNIPMRAYDNEKVSIINKDSAQIDFELSLKEKKNHLQVLWDKIPGENYTISLLPGAISDFFGNQNDTLQYTATTKELGQLGTIRVKLENVSEYPVVIELTDNNNNVKQSKFVTGPLPGYTFANIDPGSYFLRVIHDSNGNRRWDTGNFLKGLQPEKISYYPEAIELRANWEIEQVFILDQE